MREGVEGIDEIRWVSVDNCWGRVKAHTEVHCTNHSALVHVLNIP